MDAKESTNFICFRQITVIVKMIRLILNIGKTKPQKNGKNMPLLQQCSFHQQIYVIAHIRNKNIWPEGLRFYINYRQIYITPGYVTAGLQHILSVISGMKGKKKKRYRSDESEKRNEKRIRRSWGKIERLILDMFIPNHEPRLYHFSVSLIHSNSDLMLKEAWFFALPSAFDAFPLSYFCCSLFPFSATHTNEPSVRDEKQPKGSKWSVIPVPCLSS